jgi:hypothetical protein
MFYPIDLGWILITAAFILWVILIFRGIQNKGEQL